MDTLSQRVPVNIEDQMRESYMDYAMSVIIGRALPVAYHAGSWDDSNRLYDTVYAEFGRCDVLVNNAGMSPLYPSVDAISEELYDKVMDVNLKGPFRLSALVGTRMAGPDHGGSDGGSIIFVSSIASHRPSPNELVYGAAKAGVTSADSSPGLGGRPARERRSTSPGRTT